jgi:hypothetical protein
MARRFRVWNLGSCSTTLFKLHKVRTQVAIGSSIVGESTLLWCGMSQSLGREDLQAEDGQRGEDAADRFSLDGRM